MDTLIFSSISNGYYLDIEKNQWYTVFKKGKEPMSVESILERARYINHSKRFLSWDYYEISNS